MADAKVPPRLATLVWEDAWSDERRVMEGDDYYKNVVLINEVGWVMFDDDERVVLCREYTDHAVHDERMFSACAVVPRGMVRELKYIEGVKA